MTSKAENLWFMTAHLLIRLSKSDNAEGLSIIEHRMAKDFAPPLHVHHRESETFVILEGRFRFQRDDDVFEAAVKANEPGGLRLGVDLPVGADGKLDLRAGTLFRCGLLGEDKGPLVSQFFLHDIAYGAQFIVQKVRPYAKKDFLTKHGDWLRAQNTGLDEWGNGYSGDNDFTKDPMLEEHDDKGDVVPPRRISTMRDIARFVNKDALHQAYFNAALLCLSWGVMFDQGNPYLRYTRQGNFGTFGGPDLLTRVSEVASRALAVVWRQKWEVHRRLRPEA